MRTFVLGLALIVLIVGVLILGPLSIMAAPVQFINDFAAFEAATENQHTIDFETLPDGSASVAGAPLTPAFNFGEQGARFSFEDVPETSTFIAGIFISGFDLVASNDDFLGGGDVGIRIEFPSPVGAAGIFFDVGTTLSIFDERGSLIDSASFEGSGEGFFLGFTSTTPIFYATVSRGSISESIESVVFVPIGEPNDPPVVEAGNNQMVFEEGAVTLDPSTFTDADSEAHAATIIWGDGSPAEEVDPSNITEPDGGPGTIVGSHVYPDQGVFTVTVRVIDNHFNTASDTFVVTVVLYKCGGLERTHLGTAAAEIISGTPGDDVIVGRGGDDVILGFRGNYTICGGAGGGLH